MSDVHTYSSDVAFTPAVKAIQTRKGSRDAYAHVEEPAAGAPRSTKISPASWRETNSFYLATATADGQPYIQHRGGPKGFVKILDKNTIAFADYSGNRQYITQGNLSENPKAHIFVMDYAHRRRVKIWGEARVVDDDPALTKSLMPQGYKARPEQVILFRISAWDTNCPQHIPQKFDAADVAAALASRDARIAELEAELAALKGQPAPASLGGLLQRRPGELRIVLQHHPVDIGGEVGELLGALRAAAIRRTASGFRRARRRRWHRCRRAFRPSDTACRQAGPTAQTASERRDRRPHPGAWRPRPLSR